MPEPRRSRYKTLLRLTTVGNLPACRAVPISEMQNATKAEAAASVESYRCACGNSELQEGFYLCDDDGRRIRDGHLRCCDRCGKITQAETWRPVGQRSFVFPSRIDAA